MPGIEARRVMSVGRAMSLDSNKDLGGTLAVDALDLRAWKAALGDDLDRSMAAGRWPSALVGVAWVHLLCFAGCQAVYDPAVIRDLRHPVLWTIELLLVLAVLRNVLGQGWMRSSPAISLVVKLWGSFLILSFNVVSLNAVTGFEQSWYKPVWGTLSTFLFASLAWLFSPLFLINAVQMWLTGLLMVNLPHWCFLIYGVSWWLALLAIAGYLRRKQAIPRAR